MKVPILKQEAAMLTDTCDSCRFADPNKLEGATKVKCMRFPTVEIKRTSDWCGEYQMSQPRAKQYADALMHKAGA